MILEAQDRAEAEGRQFKTGAPSLATWSPELEALAGIADRLSALLEAQKTKPKKPTRYARPKPLLERKRKERENKNRWKAHEKLVARVIRNPPAAGQ